MRQIDIQRDRKLDRQISGQIDRQIDKYDKQTMLIDDADADIIQRDRERGD